MAPIADLQPLRAPHAAEEPGADPTPIPSQAGARLAGHADLSNRPDFEQLLVVLCRHGAGDVSLDLSELDFIDVSGVITLLRVAGTMTGGRHLVLRNPPASLRRILEVLGPAADDAGVRIVE